MWHIEIQKGQLEDVHKSAQEEEAATRKGLWAHGAKQLHREEGALKKAERSRLLRVRWVVDPPGRWPLSVRGPARDPPRVPARRVLPAPPPAHPTPWTPAGPPVQVHQVHGCCQPGSRGHLFPQEPVRRVSVPTAAGRPCASRRSTGSGTRSCWKMPGRITRSR